MVSISARFKYKRFSAYENGVWWVLKWGSLASMVAQSTAIVLLTRYAQRQADDEKREHYLPSTAVLMSEVVKLISCLAILLIVRRGNVAAELWGRPLDALRMGVPAVLYVLQNNLVFYALTQLDGATFQVTYQSRILWTVLLAVTMLNMRLSVVQWLSLVVLTAGVILIQTNGGCADGLRLDGMTAKRVCGLAAVVAAGLVASFANVYIEKVLKSSDTGLIARNVQLSALSIVPSLSLCFATEEKAIMAGGFFQGYNGIVLGIVCLQAYGGFLMAVVVKYADNVVRLMAVSVSMILSALLSWQLVGDFEPTRMFAIGTTLVIISTWMYAWKREKKFLRAPMLKFAVGF